ncbi:uncharacterized protein LOC115436457 [Sphaeramia orbicularis]|uniref:uncharacterized protein LOC115436457 n=1 Tax=Sphaeramia orbicularis TaxID=375764 RepID=UPI00117BFB6D|nr:uncharacterized protein LOC115436457 [Sphaeramia orbicularis]
MASTPSASALSAVLRCRRNIWTRNSPSKRPAASAYSLGLSGGTGRDSAAEHSRSKQASAWEAFLHGERVVVGRLAVAYTRVDGNVSRKKEPVTVDKVCQTLSQPRLWDAGDAHSSVQNALMRQLARKLTPNFPGTDKCSQMIRKIQNEKFAAHICYAFSIHRASDFPHGVLRVSLSSTCLMEKAGQIPSFLWLQLKSTCVSLSSLVSQIMLYKLAVLCKSNSPQLCQQDVSSREDDVVQVNGQISGPADFLDDCFSENKVTEDRPD